MHEISYDVECREILDGVKKFAEARAEMYHSLYKLNKIEFTDNYNEQLTQCLVDLIRDSLTVIAPSPEGTATKFALRIPSKLVEKKYGVNPKFGIVMDMRKYSKLINLTWDEGNKAENLAISLTDYIWDKDYYDSYVGTAEKYVYEDPNNIHNPSNHKFLNYMGRCYPSIQDAIDEIPNTSNNTDDNMLIPSIFYMLESLCLDEADYAGSENITGIEECLDKENAILNGRIDHNDDLNFSYSQLEPILEDYRGHAISGTGNNWRQGDAKERAIYNMDAALDFMYRTGTTVDLLNQVCKSEWVCKLTIPLY